VLADFRVYLNTFLLNSNIHYKLNMLGLILTTTAVTNPLIASYVTADVVHTAKEAFGRFQSAEYYFLKSCDWYSRFFDGLSHAGPALSRCNRCSCIGPRTSGGPAPWCLNRLFILPDTPCA